MCIRDRYGTDLYLSCYNTTVFVTTYFRYVEDQKARHAGRNNHEHSQAISRVNEEVYGQHKTERCSNANKDYHNVHSDADKARVIDVEVLDISALIGQEQAKHHQQPLVDVKCSNEIAKVITLTLFISTFNITVSILQRRYKYSVHVR